VDGRVASRSAGSRGSCGGRGNVTFFKSTEWSDSRAGISECACLARGESESNTMAQR
jgi:hypothetical protein